MKSDGGNRVEVRVRFRYDDMAGEHAYGCAYKDELDAGSAVRACVAATLPRPLAVLADAVQGLIEGQDVGEDPEEERLASALYAAAVAYTEFWGRHDRAACPPEG